MGRLAPAVRVELTHGFIAIVDQADYTRVSQHKWHVTWLPAGRWYARGRAGQRGADGRRRLVTLHRFVLGLENQSEPWVDHVNGDTLDCRRVNLRPATFAESARNRAPRQSLGEARKGVRFHTKHGKWGKWDARIMVDGKRIELGRFDNKMDAIRAYDEAARRLHGEFARPNLLWGD